MAKVIGDETGTRGVLFQVPSREPGWRLMHSPDGRVGLHRRSQIVELEQLCAGLTESGAMFRYAEGKWTIKEVIGHLLDTERVFAHRLLRISRGDVTELSGFGETAYAPEGQFHLRSLAALVSEFTRQRASTLALVNGIPPDAWPWVGTAKWFSHERSGPCFTSFRGAPPIIVVSSESVIGCLRHDDEAPQRGPITIPGTVFESHLATQ